MTITAGTLPSGPVNLLGRAARRLLYVVAAALVLASLDRTFYDYMVYSYDYFYDAFRVRTPQEHAITLAFFAAPLLWLPMRIRRPSDVAIWMFYIFSYTATVFMAFLIWRPNLDNSLGLLVLVLAGLVIIDLARRLAPRIRQGNSLGWVPLEVVFFVFAAFVCLYALALVGGSFNLDVEQANERREIAREVEGGIKGYVLGLGRSVLIVFGTYLAFAKRKIVYLAPAAVFVLAVFSYDGSKSTVMLFVMLAGICFALQVTRQAWWLFAVMPALIVSGLIEVNFTSNDYIIEYFVRRLLAVPGYLNLAYWDFFSVRDKVLMTDSIGRLFHHPVYDVGTTYLIGEEYLRSMEANANTGIWLSGYAHFGVFGVIVMSLLAGLILGLVDGMTRDDHFLLGCLVCAYIGLTWSEQTLHTAMLTGGIAYLLLMLFLVKSSRRLAGHWASTR